MPQQIDKLLVDEDNTVAYRRVCSAATPSKQPTAPSSLWAEETVRVHAVFAKVLKQEHHSPQETGHSVVSEGEDAPA